MKERLRALREGRLHLVSASAPVDVGGPAAFLRAMEGQPRGFWARGDRWVAHAGATWVVEVPPGEDAPDRIGKVWSRARRLLSELGAEPAEGDPPPRLYGGFSFGDDHAPAGMWQAFPPARFLLPAVELVGDDRGAELRARAVLRDDDGAGEASLRERVSELADVLAERVAPQPPAPVPSTRAETDEETWGTAVDDVLGAIHRGEVTKVVLARTLDVTTAAPLDPVDVVGALRRENPGTHVFLFEPSPGSALVGAAPETVATLSRGFFRATAVAGSIRRGSAPEEQEALALRLLESHKDQVEHAIALQDMLTRLAPYAHELSTDPEPHVLTLSRIQHLETRIRAHLRPGVTVLDALGVLHPTPAVCGLPRDAAFDVLRRDEPFRRGWYAGPVGWFDGRGNGVFAPALRSAVQRGRTWRLFAGAGIVAESDPALEWEETRIKFEPALRALEASGARLDGRES